MKELFEKYLSNPVVPKKDCVSLLALAYMCKDLHADALTMVKSIEDSLSSCFKNTELESANYKFDWKNSSANIFYFDSKNSPYISVKGAMVSCEGNQSLIILNAGKCLREFSRWYGYNYVFVSKTIINYELENKIKIVLSSKGISMTDNKNINVIFGFSSGEFYNNSRNIDFFELTNNREEELFAKINIPLSLLSEYFRNKLKGIELNFTFDTPTTNQIFNPYSFKAASESMDISADIPIEVEELDLENDLAISTYGLKVQAALTNIVEILLKSTNSAALEDCAKIVNEMIETIKSDIKGFNPTRNGRFRGLVTYFQGLYQETEKSIIDDNSLLKYKDSCVNNANILGSEYKVFLEQKLLLLNKFVPLIESYRNKCQDAISNNPDLPEDKVNRLHRRIADLSTSIAIACQCIETINFSNLRREISMFKQFDIYTKMIPAWGVLELHRRTLLRDYLNSEIDNAFNFIFVAYLQGNNDLMTENMSKIENYLPENFDASLLMSSLHTLLPETGDADKVTTPNNGFGLH